MRGSIFTGGATQTHGKRQGEDYYATPPTTTKLFLDSFDLSKFKNILEPSCGGGYMAEVIKEYYPNANIDCTDLIDRGYGQGGIDFLNHNFDKQYDLVITNPPFKLAKEFIEKALEVSNDTVIMLAKIQLLESEDRKDFLKNSCLKYIYGHSKRQSCWKNGDSINPNTGKQWSGAMMLAWYVFERGV